MLALQRRRSEIVTFVCEEPSSVVDNVLCCQTIDGI